MIEYGWIVHRELSGKLALASCDEPQQFELVWIVSPQASDHLGKDRAISSRKLSRHTRNVLNIRPQRPLGVLRDYLGSCEPSEERMRPNLLGKCTQCRGVPPYLHLAPNP